MMKPVCSRCLDVAAKLLPVSAAIYFFSFITADPDLWGHIKFGEDIWRAKGLVRVDPFSFTAYGQPWINHEWLSEIIFYLTYRQFGDAGLLFGKLSIGLCIVAVLSNICAFRKQMPIVYATVMVLAISVISPGFMIRPQVFSFLFFSLFLYVLHQYLSERRNLLFLLPCLMALWVNLHGGFLMGWTLLITVVTWKTLTHFIFGKKTKHLGALWMWLLIASAATLLNPYGYKLLVFLYKTLSLPRQISEWNPVPLFDMSHSNLKLLALLFLATLCKEPKQNQGWELVACAMTLIASFCHGRHMPFFGIIVAPHLVFRLSALISDIQPRFPRLTFTRTSQNLVAIFLGILIAHQTYTGTRRYVMSNCRIIVDPETYPVTAVRFLQLNDIRGNLLLPFDWGEYAIWKLYPGCKVSVDGRFRTVYPEPVIRAHFIPDNDWAGWKALIEKYPSDIILARQTPFFQALIQKGSPWTYVYSDSIAIVFLRNSQKNKEALQRFKAGRFEYTNSPPSIYFP
jgi:hypothetical protein